MKLPTVESVPLVRVLLGQVPPVTGVPTDHLGPVRRLATTEPVRNPVDPGMLRRRLPRQPALQIVRLAEEGVSLRLLGGVPFVHRLAEPGVRVREFGPMLGDPGLERSVFPRRATLCLELRPRVLVHSLIGRRDVAPVVARVSLEVLALGLVPGLRPASLPLAGLDPARLASLLPIDPRVPFRRGPRVRGQPGGMPPVVRGRLATLHPLQPAGLARLRLMLLRTLGLMPVPELPQTPPPVATARSGRPAPA